jgi:hypothetical protein
VSPTSPPAGVLLIWRRPSGPSPNQESMIGGSNEARWIRNDNFRRSEPQRCRAAARRINQRNDAQAGFARALPARRPSARFRAGATA